MKKIIILAFVLGFILTGCVSIRDKFQAQNKGKLITLEETKTKAENFVNNNLMPSGSKITIKEVSSEAGLYKIIFILPNKQEIISYLTRDGKKFFPEAMDIAEIEAQKAGANQNADNSQPSAGASNKKDKPEVELFVMSHCPYGTQIEKGIIPAVEALGDKIDFKLKFCSYIMHGEEEINEELTQSCISKEEPAKLLSYLKCFLKDKKSSASCLQSTGINTGEINSCVAVLDGQYKVKEKFKDKSAWVSGQFPPFDVFKADNDKYGVKGSPTLVINGEEVQTGRDSAALLKAICSGFNSEPAECQKKLSGTAPSPGFGSGTSGSNSQGGCAN